MAPLSLGRKLIANSNNPGRIALVCLLGSIQFFLITNFFVWLGAEVEYPHTIAGLIACYTAALPFFEHTVLGDLFYTAVLNLAYFFVVRQLADEGHSEKIATR